MREERFARWRAYFAGLKERESFKKSFDEVRGVGFGHRCAWLTMVQVAFKQAYALRVADFRKP